MSDAGKLHDVTQAMRVLRQLRGLRGESLRRPDQSASQHYAAMVGDHEWSALATALEVLGREADELQSYIDAREAAQRRVIGPFAQAVIDQVQP